MLIKGAGFSPFSPPETLISYLIFFLFAVLYSIGLQENVAPVFIALFWMFVFYCCLMGLGSFLSGTSSLQVLASLTLHLRFVFISVIVAMCVNGASRQYLVAAMISICWVVAIYAVVQVTAVTNSAGGVLNFDVVKRTLSIFPNPNMFGAVLLIGVVLYLPYFEKFPTRFSSINTFCVTLPLCTAMLVSYSRRSWLALAIIIFLFLLFKRGNNATPLKFLAPMVMVFFFLVDLTPIIERIGTIFDPEYASNSARLSDFRRMLVDLTSSPFSILGGGGAGTIGPSHLSPGSSDAQIDSYFLLLLLEYGIIGLMLYLALIWYGMTKMIRKMSWDLGGEDSYNEYLSYALCVLGLLIVSFVGTTSITFPINLFHWILIGLLVRRC